MSKFCTSCGASLDDNATFCTACGTKLAAPAPAPAQAAPAQATPAQAATANAEGTPLDALKDKTVDAFNSFKNNPNRNTIIGIAAIAVAVIILIILLVSLLSGGYKGALKDYFGSIEDKDGKAYAQATMSGDMIDEMLDESGLKKDKFYDGYKAVAKSTYNNLKEDFGSGIKIDFDVTDKEKIDKDDLEDLETLLAFVMEDIKISKGYEVELEVTVEGKDDEDTFDAEATVLKVDGDWIVMDLSVEDCRALNISGMDASDFDDFADAMDSLAGLF